MQPIRISDLKKVDPIKACEYFNRCFKDPSAFTVAIVGKIDPGVSLPLILQYLVMSFSFFLLFWNNEAALNMIINFTFCRVGYLGYRMLLNHLVVMI